LKENNNDKEKFEEGHPLAGSRSYDEDIQGYIDFLNKGLK
jgi:thiol:disulfide interchange protein DsbD